MYVSLERDRDRDRDRERWSSELCSAQLPNGSKHCPSSSSSSSSAISSSQTTPTDDGSAVASKLDSLAVSDASTPSDDIDTPQISLKSEVLDEETEAAEPSQIKTVCLPLFSFPHMRTARFYPPGKMVYA